MERQSADIRRALEGDETVDLGLPIQRLSFGLMFNLRQAYLTPIGDFVGILR
jgi:hypothetical protein